jgi:hypothetical protein
MDTAALVSNPFIKMITIHSKYLSDFFGRTRLLKAAVLLPSTYFENPGRTYPICYRAPGLNGRYDQLNGMMQKKDFADWWMSKRNTAGDLCFLRLAGPLR